MARALFPDAVVPTIAITSVGSPPGNAACRGRARAAAWQQRGEGRPEAQAVGRPALELGAVRERDPPLADHTLEDHERNDSDDERDEELEPTRDPRPVPFDLAQELFLLLGRALR